MIGSPDTPLAEVIIAVVSYLTGVFTSWIRRQVKK